MPSLIVRVQLKRYAPFLTWIPACAGMTGRRATAYAGSGTLTFCFISSSA